MPAPDRTRPLHPWLRLYLVAGAAAVVAGLALPLSQALLAGR